jgi:hypothetical protein
MSLVLTRSSVLVALLSLASCTTPASDGPDDSDGGGGEGSPGGSSSATGGGGGEGASGGEGGQGEHDQPLYVVSTGTVAGDRSGDFVGYLAVVDSLEPGTFDLKGALEIEPSWIFGRPGESSVYAASIFSPTLWRYDLQEDGTLALGDTVSFANYGLESAYLAASAPIYSDEKSYFVDDVQDQLVIWNPKEMTVIGTIPLGDDDEGLLPPAPEGTIVQHGGLLFTEVNWSDWKSDSSTYGTHTRLHVIDPATDSLLESVDDERLNYASPLSATSDGTLYYSPVSLISAYREIGPSHGCPSLALRVKPSEHTFDKGYELDLSSLVGGRPAGDLIWLDDSTAVLRVWHAELADEVTPENWEEVLWAQPGFLWWRWHVGDDEAVQIPDQEPGTLAASLVRLDGKTYVIRTSADSTTSTLDEITKDGKMRPGLTGPGQFIGNAVVRIR